MGFRIKKSLKIAPGLKLNVGKKGMSLSLGGRGVTMNLSERGARTTYSLPGTGLSYSSTSATTKTAKEQRATEKALLKQQQEAERQCLLEEAEVAYQQFQDSLTALQSILKDRLPRPDFWFIHSRPQTAFSPAVFTPSAFSEPEPSFSPQSLTKELETELARPPYLVYLVLVASFTAASLYPWLLLLGILISAGISLAEKRRLQRLCKTLLPLRLQEQQAAFEQRRQVLYADYQALVALEQQAHEVQEKQRRLAWEQEEAFRARLRRALETQTPEPLLELLERELAQECLPVPLGVEVACDTIETVSLVMQLPDFSVIPEQRLSLTTTGKLSSRKMAQRDRLSLYSDVCSGLALRLLDLTFSVLPSVQTVIVEGYAQAGLVSVPSLRIQMLRPLFDKVQWEAAEPSVIFERLGGVLACDRQGRLLPL